MRSKQGSYSWRAPDVGAAGTDQLPPQSLGGGASRLQGSTRGCDQGCRGKRPQRRMGGGRSDLWPRRLQRLSVPLSRTQRTGGALPPGLLLRDHRVSIIAEYSRHTLAPYGTAERSRRSSERRRWPACVCIHVRGGNRQINLDKQVESMIDIRYTLRKVGH